jgi:hypothetical protein
VSGASEQVNERFVFGIRVLANQIPRASLRMTLTYQFLPNVSGGIEYNPRAGDISPLANWRVFSESPRRPALIVGTSSDRIGTPSGQSFYGTLSKSLEHEIGLPIAPYAGLAYGTFENRLRPIGGARITFNRSFEGGIIFDGVHLHPTLSYSLGRHIFTFLLVRGHDPGVSYSIAF